MSLFFCQDNILMEFPICRLKVKELREIAKQMGLEHKGLKKCQLILLLERNGANESPASDEEEFPDVEIERPASDEEEFPDVEFEEPQKKQLRFGENKLDFIPSSKTKGRKSIGTRTKRTLTEEQIKSFIPRKIRNQLEELERMGKEDINIKPVEKPKPQLKPKQNDTMERFNQLKQLEKNQLIDIIWKMMDDRGMEKTEGKLSYRYSTNSIGERFLEKLNLNTYTKLGLKSLRKIDIIFEILKLEEYDVRYTEYSRTIGGIDINELDKDNPNAKIKYQPKPKPKIIKQTQFQVKKAVEEEYEKVKKQIKENPEDYDEIMEYYISQWNDFERMKEEDNDEFVKYVEKNPLEYEKVKYIFSKKDILLPKQKQPKQKQQQPKNKMKQIKIKDIKEFNKRRARSNPSFKYIYDMLNDDGVYDTTDDRASYVVETLIDKGIIE